MKKIAGWRGFPSRIQIAPSLHLHIFGLSFRWKDFREQKPTARSLENLTLKLQQSQN